ncbi:hypothetical protein C8Q73DRAFT_787148 [Cubamyces lactineus]|nr:hypothetical protein C8Q73DRAFT_787148 [Cubamyces lactineus]
MSLESQQPVQPKKASAGANAWILYRKEVMPALRQLDEDAGLPVLPQSEYSKVVSRLWHSASEAERSIYRQRAKQMRDEETAKANLDPEMDAGASGVILPTLTPTDPAWFRDGLAMTLSSPGPSSTWSSPTQGNSSSSVLNTGDLARHPSMFIGENAGSYLAAVHSGAWADSTPPSMSPEQTYIQNSPYATHEEYGFAVETQAVAQPLTGYAYDPQELPSAGAQYHGLSRYHTPSLSLDETGQSSAPLASCTLPEENALPAGHGWDTTTSSEQGAFFDVSAYAAPGTSTQVQSSVPYNEELALPYSGSSNTYADLLIHEPYALPEQEQVPFSMHNVQYSLQPQELHGLDFLHTTPSFAFPPSTPGPMLSLLMSDDLDASLKWTPFGTQDLQPTLDSPSSPRWDNSAPEDHSPGTYYDWAGYDTSSLTPPADVAQSSSSATSIWSSGEGSAVPFWDQFADYTSSEYPTQH